MFKSTRRGAIGFSIFGLILVLIVVISAFTGKEKFELEMSAEYWTLDLS